MMYGTSNSGVHYSPTYTIYNSTTSSTTNAGWTPVRTVRNSDFDAVFVHKPSKPTPKNIDIDAWSDVALGNQD